MKGYHFIIFFESSHPFCNSSAELTVRWIAACYLCNALMGWTVLQGFLMATAGFLSVSRSVLRPGDLTYHTLVHHLLRIVPLHEGRRILGSRYCMCLCNEGNLCLLRHAMPCRGAALPEGSICL